MTASRAVKAALGVGAVAAVLACPQQAAARSFGVSEVPAATLPEPARPTVEAAKRASKRAAGDKLEGVALTADDDARANRYVILGGDDASRACFATRNADGTPAVTSHQVLVYDSQPEAHLVRVERLVRSPAGAKLVVNDIVVDPRRRTLHVLGPATEVPLRALANLGGDGGGQEVFAFRAGDAVHVVVTVPTRATVRPSGARPTVSMSCGHAHVVLAGDGEQAHVLLPQEGPAGSPVPAAFATSAVQEAIVFPGHMPQKPGRSARQLHIAASVSRVSADKEPRLSISVGMTPDPSSGAIPE